jgi:hypothetical protein
MLPERRVDRQAMYLCWKVIIKAAREYPVIGTV